MHPDKDVLPIADVPDDSARRARCRPTSTVADGREVTPNAVGSVVVATRPPGAHGHGGSGIRSAIETYDQPVRPAKRRHCGARIMAPSSFTNWSAPDGLRPASVARSTAALRVPGAAQHAYRARARNGITCPGRVSSAGSVAESDRTLMVWARSAAEMPRGLHVAGVHGHGVRGSSGLSFDGAVTGEDQAGPGPHRGG